MTYTCAEFNLKVAEIVRDDSGKLLTTAVDSFIQEAVKIYSKHRPRNVVRDIAGDGTYDYSVMTNLNSWVKGFSQIVSVEYPADQREPEILDGDDWQILEKETGQYIRFLSHVPAATETIRFIYTILHKLLDAAVTISIATPAVISYSDHGLKPGDAFKLATTGALPTGITAGSVYYVISAGLTTNAFELSATPGGEAVNSSGSQSGAHSIMINTIPEIDQDALCNLAASLCSGALASVYAHTSDSTIGADSVDHMSKSREFAGRARVQKQTYLDHLGLKEGDIPPASVVMDLDIDYPWGGDRLTHPRNWK